MEHRIKRIEELPKKYGKAFLLKHLKGEKLTRDKAIKAKCYECMGYFVDGLHDCKVLSCLLYPYMPFKGGR